MSTSRGLFSNLALVNNPVEECSTDANLVVYVGNLSKCMTDEDIKKLLEIYGEVNSWDRHNNPSNGEKMPFGFCRFKNLYSVFLTIRLLDGRKVGGNALRVNCNDGLKEKFENTSDLICHMKRQDLKDKKEEEENGLTEIELKNKVDKDLEQKEEETTKCIQKINTLYQSNEETEKQKEDKEVEKQEGEKKEEKKEKKDPKKDHSNNTKNNIEKEKGEDDNKDSNYNSKQKMEKNEKKLKKEKINDSTKSKEKERHDKKEKNERRKRGREKEKFKKKLSVSSNSDGSNDNSSISDGSSSSSSVSQHSYQSERKHSRSSSHSNNKNRENSMNKNDVKYRNRSVSNRSKNRKHMKYKNKSISKDRSSDSNRSSKHRSVSKENKRGSTRHRNKNVKHKNKSRSRSDNRKNTRHRSKSESITKNLEKIEKDLILGLIPIREQLQKINPEEEDDSEECLYISKDYQINWREKLRLQKLYLRRKRKDLIFAKREKEWLYIEDLIRKDAYQRWEKNMHVSKESITQLMEEDLVMEGGKFSKEQRSKKRKLRKAKRAKEKEMDELDRQEEIREQEEMKEQEIQKKGDDSNYTDKEEEGTKNRGVSKSSPYDQIQKEKEVESKEVERNSNKNDTHKKEEMLNINTKKHNVNVNENTEEVIKNSILSDPKDYSSDPLNNVNAEKEGTPMNECTNVPLQQVPQTEKEILDFKIEWNSLNLKNTMHKIYKPWIVKQIIEYIGEEERELITELSDYFEQQLLKETPVKEMLVEAEKFLDSDGKQFILNLYKLIISEQLKIKYNS